MSRRDKIPQVIEYHRDTHNGMYPSANYYRRIVDAANHLVAYRHREVYQRTAPLGNASYGSSGTATLARWRFRTGYGVTRLQARVLLGQDNSGGVAAAPTAKLVIGGVDLGPWAYGVSAVATDDAPSGLASFVGELAVSPATAYECSLVTEDYARVLGVSLCEFGDETVDESTLYFSAWQPAAGGEIYDAHQERLALGLSQIWRRNGGTVVHWGRLTGAARTRSAATAVNLIDGSSTTPSSSTPGWRLDLRYRNSYARSGVPFELSVYGAVPAGTGAVRLVDSAGATVLSVTVNSSTAQWFTATGTLPAAVDKYDLHLVGDGTNTVSVYAVSLQEWEA